MPPPRAGPFGRRGFFRAFSAHFCVTLEHLFFKRQNVEEKNGRKMGAKMGAKICAPKICAKMGAKICALKMGAKMGAKICAPKICAKNRFEHSVCLENWPAVKGGCGGYRTPRQVNA